MLNVIQINALKLRIVRNFVIIINYYEKEIIYYEERE